MTLAPASRTLRGLTAVELLVSLVMVAVLFALSYPAVNKVLQRSRTAQCINNLRQLATGVFNYAADHAQAFPVNTPVPKALHAWYMPISGGADTLNAKLYEAVYVQHAGYLLRKAPFFCPENPAKGSSAGWTNYAMNYYLIGLKTHSIKGVKAMLTDSYETDPLECWYLTRGPYATQGKVWYGTQPLHGRQINVAFTDGHVRSLSVLPRVITSEGNLGELEAKWFHPVTQ